MPERIPIGRGATALPLNTLIKRGEGYGWIEGGGVSRSSSTTDLTLDIDSGTVRADGNIVQFSETSITLPTADPQHPRRDLVYVDYLGTVSFVQGEAAPATYTATAKFGNPVPAPPPNADINGVPLAEVWIDSNTPSASAMSIEDIGDARVADDGGGGNIPELDADPPQEELVNTQMWRNTTENQFRAYVSDQDRILSFDTQIVTSFSSPAVRKVEWFNNWVSPNWDVDGGSFTYNTPAFQGVASAYWDSNNYIRMASDPGDGLPYYPRPGDTIGMAFWFGSGDSYGPEHIWLGFADSSGSYEGDYTVRITRTSNDLQLVKSTAGTTQTQLLGETDFTVTEDTWYIMEVEYDGGGTGTHPCRVYTTNTSTDPGFRNTIAAEIANPTTDTTHRGRGLNIRAKGRCRLDHLHVVDE